METHMLWWRDPNCTGESQTLQNKERNPNELSAFLKFWHWQLWDDIVCGVVLCCVVYHSDLSNYDWFLFWFFYFHPLLQANPLENRLIMSIQIRNMIKHHSSVMGLNMCLFEVQVQVGLDLCGSVWLSVTVIRLRLQKQGLMWIKQHNAETDRDRAAFVFLSEWKWMMTMWLSLIVTFITRFACCHTGWAAGKKISTSTRQSAWSINKSE